MVDLTGMLELMIPLAGIGFFLGIFALIIYFDYLNKKAMIDKGLIPEDEKSRPENKLGWGTALLGIGISFVAARLFNLDAIATGGLILASIGIAILISYKISNQQA